MEEQLGAFEGEPVQASVIRLTGSSGDRVGHLDRGEEVYFVGKARISGISHHDVREVFTRDHAAPVISLLLIRREDGARMLDEAEALADDRFGVSALFRDAHGTVNPDTGEINGSA